MDKTHFPFAISITEAEVDMAVDDGSVVDREAVDGEGGGEAECNASAGA
jgi:hypothetical protein